MLNVKMLRKDLLESGAGVVILIAKKAALDTSSKGLAQLGFDQPMGFNWSLHRFVVSYSIRIRYIVDCMSAW